MGRSGGKHVRQSFGVRGRGGRGYLQRGQIAPLCGTQIRRGELYVYFGAITRALRGLEELFPRRQRARVLAARKRRSKAYFRYLQARKSGITERARIYTEFHCPRRYRRRRLIIGRVYAIEKHASDVRYRIAFVEHRFSHGVFIADYKNEIYV